MSLPMLIVGLILVVLAGIAFVWRGLFPRRRGDTPYCRKCRYNLTGLDRGTPEARCPECGTDLTGDAAILLGDRRVRRGLLATGIVLFVLGALPLGIIVVGTAWKVDWYRYKPTAWVLSDIRNANGPLLAQAASEVQRRLFDQSLTQEQITAFAESCLTRQTEEDGGQHAGILNQLYVSGALTEQQEQQFFANMVRFEILVRPIIDIDKETLIGVRIHQRGPTGAYLQCVTVEEYELDGRTLPRPGTSRFTYSMGYGEVGYPDKYPIHPRRLGRQTVAAEITLHIAPCSVGPGRISDATALHVETRRVTAEIDVVSELPADLVKMVHTPVYDATVAATVRISDLQVTSDFLGQSLFCCVNYAQPHPIALALEGFIVVGDQARYLGNVTFNTRRFGEGFDSVFERFDDELPDTCTVILRASEALALQDPDLFKVWDGEFWFEEVPIRVLKPDDSLVFDGDTAYKPSVYRRQTRPVNLSMPVSARGFVADLSRLPQSLRDSLVDGSDGSPWGTIRLLDEDTVLITVPADPEEVPPIVPDIPEDRRTYFEDLVDVQPHVRQRVVEGQELYVGVTFRVGGPLDHYRVETNIFSIRVGDTKYTPANSTHGFHSAGATWPLGELVIARDPGIHRVSIEFSFSFFEGTSAFRSVPVEEALYTGRRTVSAEVQVLSAEADDPLVLRHSPELDRDLAARICIGEIIAVPRSGFSTKPGDKTMRVRISFPEGCSIDAAFDGFLEAHGERTRLCWPLRVKAEDRYRHTTVSELSFSWSGDVPEKATIVLWSCKKEALCTADIYEIWDGQLRYEDVPVREAESGSRPPGETPYVPQVLRRPDTPFEELLKDVPLPFTRTMDVPLRPMK